MPMFGPADHEMNSIERCLAVMNLEEPDVVPCMPEIDHYVGSPAIGIGHYKVATDAASAVEATKRTYEKFRFDAIWPYCDGTMYLEAMDPHWPNVSWEMKDDKFQLARYVFDTIEDLEKYLEKEKWKEIMNEVRLAKVFKPYLAGLVDLQKKYKVPVVNATGNAINQACYLLGNVKVLKAMRKKPETVKHVFEMITEYYIQTLIDCHPEAPIMVWWASATSTDLLGPKDYDDFIIPYDSVACEKASRYWKVFWHICGGNKKYAIERLAEMPGISGIQTDRLWDLDEAKKICRDRKAILYGVSTQNLWTGTPKQIEDEVKTAIKHCGDGGQLAICTGCEISSYSTDENLRALREATHKYGKYPLKF